MTRSGQATRKKILDAAEQRFAERGFHGVSIRQIAREAGVDVALVNYHFGPKHELFQAVFLRRAEMLNQERLKMLTDCKAAAAPDPPELEAVIDAFTHPLLNRSARGGAGWKSYFALVAQVNNSPELAHIGMTRFFDPVVQEFIAAIRTALPDCAEEDIYWSYHFLSGALTLTFAETGRIDKLSGGVCRSGDLEAVHRRLVPYTAAGFRRLCGTGARPAAKAAGKSAAKSSSTAAAKPGAKSARSRRSRAGA